jgi:hypothetical protein
VLYNSTTVCRPSVDPTGDCDVVEYCTGTSVSCPADTRKSDGSNCTSTNNCLGHLACSSGYCIGSDVYCVGVCGDGIKAATEQWYKYILLY